MSSLGKWIVSIVIITIIGLGGYWWFTMSKQNLDETVSVAEETATTTPVVELPKPGMLTSLNTDNSDNTIDEDTVIIDSQIKSLNADSLSIDSSLNDKPVTQ